MPVRLRAGARVLAGAVAVGALLVLCLAAWVTPSPSGVGTHLQLGLTPCGFLDRTGLPCGTCGMTTSFAHFVRGDVLASVSAQPLGFGLALAASATVWVGGYAAATGRPAYRVLRRLSPGWVAGVVLSSFVIAWGWKMVQVIGRGG